MGGQKVKNVEKVFGSQVYNSQRNISTIIGDGG
jgi:hypothetical protein